MTINIVYCFVEAQIYKLKKINHHSTHNANVFYLVKIKNPWNQVQLVPVLFLDFLLHSSLPSPAVSTPPAVYPCPSTKYIKSLLPHSCLNSQASTHMLCRMTGPVWSSSLTGRLTCSIRLRSVLVLLGRWSVFGQPDISWYCFTLWVFLG